MSTTTFLNVFQRLATRKNGSSVNELFFGPKLGLITRVAGCRHQNIGRPFGDGKTGYRCCLDCGARRQFNPDTLETYGSFYGPPAVRS